MATRDNHKKSHKKKEVGGAVSAYDASAHTFKTQLIIATLEQRDNALDRYKIKTCVASVRQREQ